ncbi:MAG TPA: hypothetical protein VGF24_29450 [Vicinamibacterales bacterium]
MTRLIVLPFRILRTDSETDFLAFSLPDAITSGLSGLDSLIVRSSLVASRLAGQGADLRTIASEADVDVVLTGTLVRAGEQLRVSTELVEAPGGTLVWSHSSRVPLGDIFRLQDDLAMRIVGSLSLPLTAREHRMLKHDVPANTKAYEFYLRANQLAGKLSTPSLARDLYLECLAEDPIMRRHGRAWAVSIACSRSSATPTLSKTCRAQKRRSCGRSRSILICRSRTTCIRTSRSTPVGLRRRWFGSSGGR